MSQQAALDSLNRLLPDFTGSNLMNEKMGQEIKVLFPCIKTISVSKSLQLRVDSLRMDTLTYAFVDCDRTLSKQEKEKNVGMASGTHRNEKASSGCRIVEV